uniref:Uncharacterized protein n=1 Tax=Chromera velia CCMP2878 TaxID=1169474 RepID=A0A0G4H140_9ALVE|mmetsp:Transcript_52841/g.103337  ORF Transcript_52841/g.103337 Transcript_52841/m.103337 type:complete len:169 (-) Transcript_52841:142-648(-)|eukprot:Cvel_5535.t1-p1 / transcript=Cvel_5535.t1 / gene=Cvel_5535 / organism=Chromera_velia_CCMP2878 / gene_product=hypothetical protein / transcript_product=hypothetical protein / location=Cvel_scaffold259:70197-70700(-) / protein_length=168 / sequence_SO=supercontig / SO=protein_coding / is_pseudo=false
MPGCHSKSFFSAAERALEILSLPRRVGTAKGIRSFGSRPTFNWWELYVMGLSPEYPPRWRSCKMLAENDIDPFQMSSYEVNRWEQWLGTRELIGTLGTDLKENPKGLKKEDFPRLPFGITWEDKVSLYRLRYPLSSEKKESILRRLDVAREQYSLAVEDCFDRKRPPK